MGGSAYSMARDIGEGYVTVTERTMRKMTRAEIDKLGMELDRFLRDLRGTAVNLQDLPALQARNRKIQRLTAAAMVARSYKMRIRK